MLQKALHRTKSAACEMIGSGLLPINKAGNARIIPAKRKEVSSPKTSLLFAGYDPESGEERHLGGLAFVHQAERFGELFELEAMGDNGRGINHPGSDEGLGLVPCLPDKAA